MRSNIGVFDTSKMEYQVAHIRRELVVLEDELAQHDAGWSASDSATIPRLRAPALRRDIATHKELLELAERALFNTD